jgi:hypothetical protein
VEKGGRMTEQDLMIQQQKSLTYVDPAAVAAAETAKARIQSAYIMAYQKPRSEDQARARILEACKRPGFAERVEYAKPVGGRSITGPSVRFAELALREWGNNLTESQVIYEDTEIRRVRVTVIDLETNATFSKELSVRKTVERKKADDREIIGKRVNKKGELVYIVLSTDDELHNKEAALISKAIRNEGLRIIPTDIVDEALDTAKATLRNRDSQDPKAAKKRVMDSFSAIGIKPRDLETYLGHSLDTVAPSELETLRGVYAALKEGDATWADYVQPRKEGEKEEVPKKTATESLVEKTRKPRKETAKPIEEQEEPTIPGIPLVPLVDKDSVEEIEIYCAKLDMNLEDKVEEYSKGQTRDVRMMDNDGAGRLLSYLMDTAMDKGLV